MPHKNYFLYIPDDDARKTAQAELRKIYGKNSIYHLNSSQNFVVKSGEGTPMREVMDIVGFDEKGQVVGVVLELSPELRNGWYSKDFWDWLRSPLSTSQQ